MMQMPLLSYPHFSQFLQLQQQQQQHHQQQQQQQQFQQRYSRVFLSNTQNSETAMISSSRRSGTSCSEASTGTPSPSPSPPLSINENFSTGNSHQSSAKTSKSFTIDAILGLQDREIDKINRDHLNVMSSSFHPRIGLQLPTSAHLEIPNKYSSLLDLTNATIEIGTRRIDVTRLSTSSRDVLGFQLPTDLSATSDVSTFGPEIGRRDLNHQISSYQTSNSCTRLSEKSPNDSSKKCGGKSKRVRTIFTPEQLERLEAEFERQQYMVGPERLYLAHTLQLTEAQVKVWFQNRRIKWRKQHLEIQQQRLAAIKQQTQRGDIEDSDEESDDSNNYPFIKDSNDNSGNGFYKSAESISEMDNAELGQYRDELGSFQSENCKNESNDGAV